MEHSTEVVRPKYEIVFTFKKRRSTHIGHKGFTRINTTDVYDGSIAVFQGLFTEVVFNQKLITDYSLDNLDIGVMCGYIFKELSGLNGHIRLAIKKFVDIEGKPGYAKYIDFDKDALFNQGSEKDLNLLRAIITVLLDLYDLDGKIIAKAAEERKCIPEEVLKMIPEVSSSIIN